MENNELKWINVNDEMPGLDIWVVVKCELIVDDSSFYEGKKIFYPFIATFDENTGVYQWFFFDDEKIKFLKDNEIYVLSPEEWCHIPQYLGDFPTNPWIDRWIKKRSTKVETNA